MNVLFALYFSSLLPYPIIPKYVIIWNMTHTIVNAESCGYDRQVPSIQILQILEVRFRLIGELISIYCLCCSIYFKQHFSNFGLCENSLRRCLKIQTFNLRNWELKKIESQRDVVTLFLLFFSHVLGGIAWLSLILENIYLSQKEMRNPFSKNCVFSQQCVLKKSWGILIRSLISAWRSQYM